MIFFVCLFKRNSTVIWKPQQFFYFISTRSLRACEVGIVIFYNLRLRGAVNKGTQKTKKENPTSCLLGLYPACLQPTVVADFCANTPKKQKLPL